VTIRENLLFRFNTNQKKISCYTKLKHKNRTSDPTVFKDNRLLHSFVQDTVQHHHLHGLSDYADRPPSFNCTVAHKVFIH
jgi:hypothetical protein